MRGTLYKKPISKSRRAGIQFPVARVQRKLRNIPQTTGRVGPGAGVYLAGVLEYLTAELLELSGNVCKSNKRKRITPRHVLLAIGSDEELFKLTKGIIIPSAGVMFPKTQHDAVAFNTRSATSAQNKKPIPIIKPSFPVPQTLQQSYAGKDFLPKSKGVTVLNERSIGTGEKITVLNADIVNVVVDAIVHPTSGTISLGGQVGHAISRAGGNEIQNIVSQLNLRRGNLGSCGVEIGDASKNMLCKKIIHVNSPHWDNNRSDLRINELTKCVKSLLTLATTNNIKTIAIPSISSGGNGFPKQVAAQTILRSINSYFRNLQSTGAHSSIQQVYFVLFDKESVGIYTNELIKLDINSD